MALRGETGWVGKQCPEHPSIRLVSTARESAAGWFLATICPECQLTDPSPTSRESHYYPSREALVNALSDDTLKWREGAIGTIGTPWAIHCQTHGQVFLTQTEYNRQLMAADQLWCCPVCYQPATWDDANYDSYQDLP